MGIQGMDVRVPPPTPLTYIGDIGSSTEVKKGKWTIFSCFML